MTKKPDFIPHLSYDIFDDFSYFNGNEIKMTEAQFAKIIDVLNQILNTLEDIKRDMPSTTAFDLDDIYTEIGGVKDAVDATTSAIRENG